jgi:signal transduction histidine kinase
MKKINKCKHRCSGNDNNNNNNNLTTNTKHNDNSNSNNKVNNSSNSCNSSSPCSELHFIFLAYQTLILTTGQNVNYEISFKCQNQNEFEFIFNDITRTKESEQKEYDIKIKNVFLTKIAHEFKNPLVSISELLSQIKDQHVQVANKCDIGTSLCEYLLLLIKDLDFFALDSKTNLYSGFTKEKINIKSLAHFCVEMGTRRLNLLQKDKDVTITCTIDDDCPNEIISDDGKVKQVLLNLITNATKFTKKGSITLHIRKEDEEYIQFVIKDTGCGIPYKRQQGLMDYKSNNNIIGTEGGIGLTIVKELTSLLGKEIEFQSEENKGSTFWFSLPINNNNTYINSNSNSNNNNNNNILHFSPIRPVHMRISNKDINAILNCTSANNNTSLLNSSGSTVKVENFDLELNSIHHHVKRSTKEQIHIVVCDDEVLARKALIRVLNETAMQMDMKLNIIEASDGIELLYLIYDNCINGNKQLHISAILSDQTMVFVNGAVCQMILSTMTNVKLDIPFYIVTAYDVNAEYFRDVKLNRVFSKPLRKCDAHVILNELT